MTRYKIHAGGRLMTTTDHRVAAWHSRNGHRVTTEVGS